MLGYITFIAILNLGLGYALAVHLHGESGGGQATGDQAKRGTQSANHSSASLPAVDRPPTEAHFAMPLTVLPVQAEVTPAGALKPAATIADAASNSATPAAAPIAQNLGLVTLDHVDQLLSEITAEGVETGRPTSVALMELDFSSGSGDVEDDRLLAGIAETVRGLLTGAQTLSRIADRRFALLLPGDDESEATQRAEIVRQSIEATEFIADDRSMHATVTCALSQVMLGAAARQAVSGLQSALAKAKRLGENRTYLCGSAEPSPVVPPELCLAPQKCAV